MSLGACHAVSLAALALAALVSPWGNTGPWSWSQNYGGWVEMVVTVYGKSSGSEAIASMRFGLEAAADDLSSEESMPPPNPFGSDACPIAN